MFSIGQLSKRTGVKVPTIRYYEQMGLIDAPERSGDTHKVDAKYVKKQLSEIADNIDLSRYIL